ncbi:dUTP diphosphatase [Planococcus sp. 4-30]|uniref:dUTP diphosphatase n=1 Tax=Planococcus sp. 4-30 TaxID=2874583 RepID=UPI001CBCF5AB|nr:dUTP diphosphatase [Planococcus sp. 4-30]
MTKLLIKKLQHDAKLPEKAHKTDAGADLFSNEENEILAGEVKLIKTGISIQLPSNTEAQIRPRSGLALKHSITVLNSPGTIDEEYRGEIGVILINHGKESFFVEKHMKIAQIVIKPILTMDIEEVEGELTKTDRGAGGFGSTGNK